MIHDCCDYCFREFGYMPGEKAICLSCGLENVRSSVPVQADASRESAMREPAAERAVKSRPRVRKSRG